MELSLTRRLWVGTYPVKGQGMPPGCGEGVWSTTLDIAAGKLGEPRQIVETSAPSFIAPGDGHLLYAVNEAIDGGVSSFRVAPDGMAHLVSTTRSGGGHPCHLVTDRTMRVLLVANYSSGTVAIIELDERGVPHRQDPDQVIALSGSGPNAARQANSHAHFVFATPDDRAILVSDLGADVIWRFRRDRAARRLVPDGIAVAMPPGSGPRHAAFAADGRFLLVGAELEGRLYVIAWDSDRMSGEVIGSGVACWTPGVCEPAHVTVDAERILLGVRGTDVLAEHRMTSGGRLKPVADHPLPGSWPRHHLRVGAWTVVALQRAGLLAVLDENGGLIDEQPLPSPACVVLDTGGRAA